MERLPSDVRGVADGMSDQDWKSLILQLGRYALQKSRRFYWRTGTSGELPYGEMTESIVSRACFLWLTGRRRWNRAEYEDLPQFLKGVIDSLLSHSANGFDNRGIEARDAVVHVGRATPESDLLDREQEALASRLLADIARESQEDDVVRAILEAMQNGAATRRAIVAATGRPAAVIDNGLKRLRRTSAHVARSRGYDDTNSR